MIIKLIDAKKQELQKIYAHKCISLFIYFDKQFKKSPFGIL